MFGADGRAAAGDPFSGFARGGLGDIFDAFFGGGAGPFGGARAGQAGRARRRARTSRPLLDLEFPRPCSAPRRKSPCGAAMTVRDVLGHGRKPGHHGRHVHAPATGRGEVRRVRQSLLGQMVTSSPCPRCGGTGEEIPTPCADCRGQGRRMEDRSYTVDVPAGVDDGSTLRL